MLGSMDIRQLEAVAAVARLGSFTRAAEELFVAQPALSATVRRLEDELGLRLFDRTTRRVALTPAGEAFVRRAERVLGDLREMRAEMADHAGAARGRLRVGAWYTVDPWLPEMLSPFHAAHPAVEVTVREVNSDRMLDLLRAGDLDVALPVLRPGLDLDEIELLPYIEEPFVLAAPPRSPLAAMRSVTLADIAGEPLITFNPGSSLRRLVEQAFAASGVEPRVALETIETSAARAMVSSGLGVAILPASVAARPGPPVVVIPLDAPPVRRSAVAWRKGPGSPARDAFLVAVSEWRDGRAGRT